MIQERQSESTKSEPDKSKLPAAKLAYHPPQFVNYGSVAKLTRGGAVASVADNGGNMMFVVVPL